MPRRSHQSSFVLAFFIIFPRSGELQATKVTYAVEASISRATKGGVSNPPHLLPKHPPLSPLQPYLQERRRATISIICFVRKEESPLANVMKGNQNGPRGENESYSIPGGGSAIPRPKVVEDVEQDKHRHFSIYRRAGVRYVRGNPDSNTKNSVNQ